MTTREENLKKINEELELLSDEELEEIAGGGYINILYANDTNQEVQNDEPNLTSPEPTKVKLRHIL